MSSQQTNLLQVLRKISILEGLSGTQMTGLLRIAQSQTFEAGQAVYISGQPSEEMLVLLQGQLVITNAYGDELGEVVPTQPIGAVGVITGQPRQVNITASRRSVAMVISKSRLDELLADDPAMHVLILKKVIAVLSQRLASSNQQNNVLQWRLTDTDEEKP